MKSNIILYGLEGCDNCNKIKKHLDSLGVQYTFSSCENNYMCDYFMKVSNSYDYPMVYFAKTKTLVHLSYNYSKSREAKELDSNVLGIAVLTLDEMKDLLTKL
jgi:glutaredoxin